MKRMRVLLLLLLLPAQSASLWALPRCQMVMVCQMAQDGSSSCCANCSMGSDQSAASLGTLIVIPALVAASNTGVVAPSPSASQPDPAEPRPFGASRDILDPPPRA